jgi:hypothetical protein
MPWKECSVMDERLRFVALLHCWSNLSSFATLRQLSVPASSAPCWHTKRRANDFRVSERRTTSRADRPPVGPYRAILVLIFEPTR